MENGQPGIDTKPRRYPVKNELLTNLIETGSEMWHKMEPHICPRNLFCEHGVCKARLSLGDFVAALMDEREESTKNISLHVPCDLLTECVQQEAS